jgi:hypothetical protein
MPDSGNIILGAATVSVGGADVGYTDGSVTFNYSPTVLNVMASQASGPVKQFRTEESASISFTMQEMTVANLQTAMMQPPANLASATKLYIGYSDACWVDEKAIVLVGKSPDCGTRTWTFSRGVVNGDVEYVMSRTEKTVAAVTFNLLVDTVGHFGYFEDT